MITGWTVIITYLPTAMLCFQCWWTESEFEFAELSNTENSDVKAREYCLYRWDVTTYTIERTPPSWLPLTFGRRSMQRSECSQCKEVYTGCLKIYNFDHWHAADVDLTNLQRSRVTSFSAAEATERRRGASTSTWFDCGRMFGQPSIRCDAFGPRHKFFCPVSRFHQSNNTTRLNAERYNKVRISIHDRQYLYCSVITVIHLVTVAWNVIYRRP